MLYVQVNIFQPCQDVSWIEPVLNYDKQRIKCLAHGCTCEYFECEWHFKVVGSKVLIDFNPYLNSLSCSHIRLSHLVYKVYVGANKWTLKHLDMT